MSKLEVYNIFFMPNESRTAKSIRNVKVALLFYFLNLILQFFSRKIFLDYLGSEVLGLNTTAQNLLGFLNLAELGIGSAVAYNLYKPLFENDRNAINAIVSIQGWLYRRIAYIVIAGACILMCFFPMIFAKAQVPLWYAYGSFIVLLIAALLSYFVNYRQIVLSADQKEYKITLSVQGVKLVKVLVQILAIRFFDHGYVWWMVLEVVMAGVTSWVLDRTIKKEYPWLTPNVSEGKLLKQQYPGIITKTKQVFFHKIGGFVLTQTSPLIIYAYASLTLVAIYGNYMLIVTGVVALMNALLNSINAGVGNLVAEGNKEKIKKTYWEITILRMWLASIICFGMYLLGHSFIVLWVGRQYVMPQPAFSIMVVITFVQLTRTNDVFIAAYGLYKDIWAPLVEACLNLGLSIILGYFYGLVGILSGILISLLIIICSWKPYFLYKEGFKSPFIEYVVHYTKSVSLLSISFVLCICVVKNFVRLVCDTYSHWLIYATVVISVYSVISLIIISVLDVSARTFIVRFWNILRK